MAAILLVVALLISSVLGLTIPSLYPPVKAACPATPLVRPATGLSSSESGYISNRSPKAAAGLAAWLQKVNAGFGAASLPTVALTLSGGGYRALLEGAGVIQAFDGRDSTAGTSGLFQGLTYQTGLSGGAWLLSSFAGNNYPTISSLSDNLWQQAFQDSLLDPTEFLAGVALAAVVNDIKAKNAAGFPPVIADPYGRLLSYQLLNGIDGGVQDTLSGITGLSNFKSFNVPYPILTSVAVDISTGQCEPSENAPIFELSPYDFGSWDTGIAAFTQTKYLGTSINNGVPTGSCYNKYDNLGYALGTSSNVFNSLCFSLPTPSNSSSASLEEALEGILTAAHSVAFEDEYAVYPNPFYKYGPSSTYNAQTSLSLADGGETGQNNPIWPLIQAERSVQVILVSDNSADTTDNFPNGTEIYTTYLQAQAVGLTKMPVIPSVATFISEGLNKRPTFFGCNDASKVTIVYLPNVNYTFPSNEPTSKLQYSKSDTVAMIANGNEIATHNGDPAWPTCLGCAIMMKSGQTLPSACGVCFSTYCYTP